MSTRLGLGLLAAAGLLVAWVGWLTPDRPWRTATGWERIPAAERPTASVLWDDTAAAGPAPELVWLGHSGFLLTWRGSRLLIDPNTSRRCTVSRRVLERPADLARLGAVDAVLISHAHYDHLDLPTLGSIPDLGTVVVPAGSEPYLPAPLRRRAVALQVGERRRLGELEVVAVRAAHNGNRYHPLSSDQLAVGYVIRTPRTSLYYAGDTGFGEHFAEIRERFHPRVAILPIGAYAPGFPLRRYHLSPEDAVEAARVLGVETVVPCHFGTFVLSLDRPSQALPRFAHAARAADLRWLMPRLR